MFKVGLSKWLQQKRSRISSNKTPISIQLNPSKNLPVQDSGLTRGPKSIVQKPIPKTPYPFSNLLNPIRHIQKPKKNTFQRINPFLFSAFQKGHVKFYVNRNVRTFSTFMTVKTESPSKSKSLVEYQPFRLDKDFVETYKHIPAPFKFNGLGEMVYSRTYSRFKENGFKEKWFETVERVVNGTENSFH